MKLNEFEQKLKEIDSKFSFHIVANQLIIFYGEKPFYSITADGVLDKSIVLSISKFAKLLGLIEEAGL